ncbi:MAG: NYN domain-containing protein [Candidatus Limivicinus sp.]|jgi:ribosomal protection tetracycline resistance protein
MRKNLREVFDTEKERKNKIPLSVGLLAHVDAGKTSLSEAMLYLSGRIKRPGRVDHRDCFLDNHELERERGITIFSKQAVVELERHTVCLLDTPGHVDFSAEMERTLGVMDYAVLVISGSDGVQAHSETLWRLLERYNVPCFIFVTKMDLPDCSRPALMKNISGRFGDGCVDFNAESGTIFENAAMCSEKAMESYLEKGRLSDEEIAGLIKGRRLFPCFFGSGLRAEGVQELMDALDRYTVAPEYRDDFGARVFKTARDPQGKRMSFIKLTGRELSARDTLKYKNEKGETLEEKITQIRIYSGTKFESPGTVRAGQICAVLGLSGTYPGQGLGAEPDASGPVLEPVLSYTVKLPPKSDPGLMYPKFMLLQDEDPQLHIVWNEQSREISVQLMGRVQAEIFKSLVKERFDTDIELDSGHVMYKETIAGTVEGVGHFEPLRHYAEVHLLLKPLPRGSGIKLESLCSEDELDRNWQRLILSGLNERIPPGVLTGSPLTDIKISLMSGRAHLKHTEGGDFRQASCRAVRQGLMQAESILLEPYYSFTIELPPEQTGRAISDIRAMNGDFSAPEETGEFTRLSGSAPVAAMSTYMAELAAYTHGKGRLFLRPDGFRPCVKQQELVDEIGYDPEGDTENPADSVFCAHGAGYNVKWNRVPEFMHLESCLVKPESEGSAVHRCMSIDDRELEAIMEREFGPIRRPEYSRAFKNEAAPAADVRPGKKQYLIVDGYNLIFAWDELKALAADSLELARGRLMDMLSNYCGYTKDDMVLVFDGYKTPGNPGSRNDYHNIHVVYTRDGETGDAYIEKLADEIGRNFSVRVITSDNLIRLSAMRSGVLRSSSKEFIAELEWVLDRIDEVLKKTNANPHMTRFKDGKQ